MHILGFQMNLEGVKNIKMYHFSTFSEDAKYVFLPGQEAIFRLSKQGVFERSPADRPKRYKDKINYLTAVL